MQNVGIRLPKVNFTELELVSLGPNVSGLLLNIYFRHIKEIYIFYIVSLILLTAKRRFH